MANAQTVLLQYIIDRKILSVYLLFWKTGRPTVSVKMCQPVIESYRPISLYFPVRIIALCSDSKENNAHALPAD